MKINSVELANMAVRVSQYPNSCLPEFLLVGRSNVGKSSYINTIINRKNFAHTSATPGKTKTLNFYLVNNNFYLVDVPGYGFASVDKMTQKKFGLMIEEYLKTRNCLKRVFLLVDYRHKPSEDDILMYNFLKYYNLNVTIVATKYDKVKMSDRTKIEKVLNSSFELKENDNIVYFSAITKKGRDEIYKIIQGYVKQDA
jgi:GTP-binding protein